MKNWRTLFYRKRYLIALTILLIVISGATAWFSLPRLEDPHFNNRFAIITTFYPGANAKLIEAQVTEKIEDALQEISEIKLMDSYSRQGTSTIFIQLQDAVVQDQIVWSRIRDELQKIRPLLPKDATSPLLDERRTFPFTRMVALVRDNPSVPFHTLQRLAKTFKKRIAALPGTDIVRIFGSPQEEVVIEVDPKKLYAHSLTIERLSEIVKSADTKMSSGVLYHPDRYVLLDVVNKFQSLDEIKRIPLKRDQRGAIVRLADIATVRQQMIEPPMDISLVNNRRAVLLAMRIESNAHLHIWNKIFNRKLTNLKQGLPSGVRVVNIFDQTHYTDTRITTLQFSLFIGMGLVCLVLFALLGWRIALVVAFSLPLTVLIALSGLKMFGQTVNQISVIGMIIALGLSVDNSIVVATKIRRLILKGTKGIDAIDMTVQEYWRPLLSSTVTTMLAFIPIVLIVGPTGEFLGGISISVMSSLAGSYFIALMITPALTVLVFTQRFITRHHGWIYEGMQLGRFGNWLEDVMHFALRHAKVSMCIVILIPLLGFVGSHFSIKQFFPRADRNQFYIDMYLPEQTSIKQTEQYAKRAYDIIEKLPSITNQLWVLGRDAPKFYYNLGIIRQNLPNFAQAMIDTKKVSDVLPAIKKLETMLNDAMPKAKFIVRALWQGPTDFPPIVLYLYGSDLMTLKRLGDQIELVVKEMPGVTHTNSLLEFGIPQIKVDADEDRLRQMNISLVDLSRRLQAQLQGVISGTYIQGSEELPVRVRFRSQYRKSIGAIYENYVIKPKLDPHELGIPLLSVAKIKFEPTIAMIVRHNNQRVNVVHGYVQEDLPPQAIMDKIVKKIESSHIKIPKDYKLSFGGQASDRIDTLNRMFANTIVIVILMLSAVVLTFHNFRSAFLVFAVGIQAMGMAMLSLITFNMPMGITVIFGIMGLIGVAINLCIIIMTDLNEVDLNTEELKAHIPKIVVGDSARHVISTTLTSTIGFSPLLFVGGNLWPPYATAFIGGILLATLLSFIFVPCAYYVFRLHKVKPKE